MDIGRLLNSPNAREQRPVLVGTYSATSSANVISCAQHVNDTASSTAPAPFRADSGIASSGLLGRPVLPASSELQLRPDPSPHAMFRPLYTRPPNPNSTCHDETSPNRSPPHQVVKRPASQMSLPDKPRAKRQSRWTPKEDDLIIELRGQSMKWDDIAKHLPGKSSTSCRLRYQNYLEKQAIWDEEKKNRLARIYARYVHLEFWLLVPPSILCIARFCCA